MRRSAELQFNFEFKFGIEISNVGGKGNALTTVGDQGVSIVGRRRRTLPPDLSGSTIRATRLNDRVRDGNGCDPRAIDTDQIGEKKDLVVGSWREIYQET